MTDNFASLEAEVDQFLSTSSSTLPSFSKLNSSISNDQDNPPKLPQLKPKPLKYGKESINNNYKIFLLMELVTRRAWNDVIKVSDDLLFGATSMYQPYCTRLMNISTVETMKNDGVVASSHEALQKEAEIQQNVVEIIQWRIRSMFHLRRYNDLKLCIENMKLTCTNYCNGEVPSWIPLSLVVQSMECLALLSGIDKKNKNKQRKKGEDSKSLDGEDVMEEEKDSDDILDEFYRLRAKISDQYASSTIEDEKKGNLWCDLLQLDLALSNVLTKNAEWRLALVTLEQIIGYSEQLAISWTKKILSSNHRSISGRSSVLFKNATQLMSKVILIEMFSRQGRILLQSGALPAAATIFERAHDENQEILGAGLLAKVSSQDSPSLSDVSKEDNFIVRQKIVQNIPTQIMINEGKNTISSTKS